MALFPGRIAIRPRDEEPIEPSGDLRLDTLRKVQARLSEPVTPVPEPRKLGRFQSALLAFSGNFGGPLRQRRLQQEIAIRSPEARAQRQAQQEQRQASRDVRLLGVLDREAAIKAGTRKEKLDAAALQREIDIEEEESAFRALRSEELQNKLDVFEEGEQRKRDLHIFLREDHKRKIREDDADFDKVVATQEGLDAVPPETLKQVEIFRQEDAAIHQVFDEAAKSNTALRGALVLVDQNTNMIEFVAKSLLTSDRTITKADAKNIKDLTQLRASLDAQVESIAKTGQGSGLEVPPKVVTNIQTNITINKLARQALQKFIQIGSPGGFTSRKQFQGFIGGRSKADQEAAADVSRILGEGRQAIFGANVSGGEVRLSEDSFPPADFSRQGQVVEAALRAIINSTRVTIGDILGIYRATKYPVEDLQVYVVGQLSADPFAGLDPFSELGLQDSGHEQVVF